MNVKERGWMSNGVADGGVSLRVERWVISRVV